MPPKQDFATIMHLAEMYGEQYRERNLCLPNIRIIFTKN